MRLEKILNSPFVFFALCVTIALFGNRAAFAQGTTQDCSNTSYSYNVTCAGSQITTGTVVVSSATAVAASNATSGLVLNRVSGFRASSSAPGKTASGAGTINLLGFGSGTAAGEKSDDKIGVWVNGAFVRVVGTETGGDFDFNTRSGMVGIDVQPATGFLIGIAGGYENTDGDTGFNRGTVDSKGHTVAPYLSIKLNGSVSFDAVGGHTWLDYDNTRLDPFTSAKISGSTDATRKFGSANLVGEWDLKDIIFGAKIGTNYVDEDVDAFTETGGSNEVSIDSRSTTVGTGNVGLKFSGTNEQVSPYLEGTYAYEYNDAGGDQYNSRHNYGGALGLNINLADGFTANIEGRGVFKTHMKNGTGSASLRYQKNF